MPVMTSSSTRRHIGKESPNLGAHTPGRSADSTRPQVVSVELAISTTDAMIVTAYLAAVVLFGVWIGRGQRNLSGYLLSSRDLPWWAILGSIVATETSTATFLSVPGIAFAASGDLRFLQLAMGFLIGRMLVALVLLPPTVVPFRVVLPNDRLTAMGLLQEPPFILH